MEEIEGVKPTKMYTPTELAAIIGETMRFVDNNPMEELAIDPAFRKVASASFDEILALAAYGLYMGYVGALLNQWADAHGMTDEEFRAEIEIPAARNMAEAITWYDEQSKMEEEVDKVKIDDLISDLLKKS